MTVTSSPKNDVKSFHISSFAHPPKIIILIIIIQKYQPKLCLTNSPYSWVKESQNILHTIYSKAKSYSNSILWTLKEHTCEKEPYLMRRSFCQKIFSLNSINNFKSLLTIHETKVKQIATCNYALITYYLLQIQQTNYFLSFNI